MERYNIVFKKSVAKDFRKIPKTEVQRILKKIEALADNPRPPKVEKLTDKEAYRIRVGKFRVVYEIEDAIITITIIKVAARKEVYKKI